MQPFMNHNNEPSMYFSFSNHYYPSRGLHLSLSKTQPVSKEMLFWWVPPWNCCSNVFPLSTTGSNGNCIKDKATWDRLKNLVRLKHKIMHLPKEENYYAAENASSGCTFHKHVEHQVSSMQTTVFKATMLQYPTFLKDKVYP